MTGILALEIISVIRGMFSIGDYLLFLGIFVFALLMMIDMVTNY